MLGCRCGILGSIKSTLDFRLKLDQYPFQEYEDSFPISNSDVSQDDIVTLFNKRTARFRVLQYLTFKPFQAPGDFHITFWCNIPDKKSNMFLFSIGKLSDQLSIYIQASSANVFLYIGGDFILCNQNLAINTWFYFIITRSSGVINIYYGNALQLSITNNLHINQDLNNTLIGRNSEEAFGEMYYSDMNMADFVFRQGAYTGSLYPTERI